jgi:extracellular factor (EF) 3-hydroxypalmitic acid methyl ester biosynthesis protein
MTAPPPVPSFEATLEVQGQKVRARVFKLSRLSLKVELLSEPRLESGAVCDRLVVHTDVREVVFSRCRVDVKDSHVGQLVFVDEIYDCDALFKQKRAINLLGFLNEVPLVLSARERIKPEFQRFVADLSYDLAVYKKFFDEQDRLLAREGQRVAEAAQTVLLARAGAEFFGFLDRSLERLTSLVENFTPEEHERHGYYFRQQLWPFIMSAAFMQRTNLKPRGYAGDATMMQMLYDNAFVGQLVFNKLLHKHPLEHPGAQAVRNRRELIPKMVRAAMVASSVPRFRLASVACGPARELEDLFVSDEDYERIELTLLDQDEEAIAAALECVARLSVNRKPINVTCVNDSVRTLLRTRDLPGRLGRFHYIYTMGMFDYLTPPVAKALLAKLYELLEPGGELLVGNYHARNPSRYYMAYWLDWILYYRTEHEMLSMAADLPGVEASVELDESKAQLFLTVRKT